MFQAVSVATTVQTLILLSRPPPLAHAQSQAAPLQQFFGRVLWTFQFHISREAEFDNSAAHVGRNVKSRLWPVEIAFGV
jgi:hypothetical protein